MIVALRPRADPPQPLQPLEPREPAESTTLRVRVLTVDSDGKEQWWDLGELVAAHPDLFKDLCGG